MTPAVQTAYVDLDTGAVRAATTGLAAPSITLILGSKGKLNFAFMADGTVGELDAGVSDPVFVIKEETDADGDPLFLDEDGWDEDGSDEDKRYAFTGVLDGDDLRTALAGLRRRTFVAQIAWNDEDGNPCSSLPFDLVIAQNYNRSGDTAPASTDMRYMRWLSTVTDLTGGGSTKLDGVATTTLSAGFVAQFIYNSRLTTWELQAVSTAEDPANGIVRPDDYNASTNLKTWIQLS